MNTISYYLIKSNGTMEGPYLVEDLQNLLETDGLSLSKENLVINSATGLKCTIKEAINLSCSETKISDFVPSSTAPRDQNKMGQNSTERTKTGGSSNQYQAVVNLKQSSHPTVAHVNQVNRIAQFNSVGVKQKNHLVAGIFALLLGGFGTHKFYNGSWGWGIIYIIFFWTYIPAFLALIEGILYLVNQNKYDQKYNKTPPFPMKW